MESPFHPPSLPPSSSFSSLHSSPSLHLPQAEPLCTPLQWAGPCRRAAQVQESVDRESDEHERSNGAHGEMQRRTRPLALSLRQGPCVRACVRACLRRGEGGGRRGGTQGGDKTDRLTDRSQDKETNMKEKNMDTITQSQVLSQTQTVSQGQEERHTRSRVPSMGETDQPCHKKNLETQCPRTSTKEHHL